MKKYFKTRLDAIDWIADHTEDEMQFEVLRENLSFNFIYHGVYFIDEKTNLAEIVMLRDK